MDEQEFTADLITLLDDDGNEHTFEIVDTLAQGDDRYVALVADDEDDDDGELVVLKVAEVDGEEFLDTIEDEAEFDKMAALFMERLSDRFDFADEDEA